MVLKGQGNVIGQSRLYLLLARQPVWEDQAMFLAPELLGFGVGCGQPKTSGRNPWWGIGPFENPLDVRLPVASSLLCRDRDPAPGMEIA